MHTAKVANSKEIKGEEVAQSPANEEREDMRLVRNDTEKSENKDDERGRRESLGNNAPVERTKST